MNSKAVETVNNLERAKMLYLTTPGGIKDSELMDILGVSINTANRYRRALGCTETGQNSYKYTLIPSEDDIEFAKAVLRRVGLRLEKDPEYLDEEGLNARLQQEMEAGY